MTGTPPPDENERVYGVFELGWLRRTDAMADPIIRARSLCGVIASAISADRVSLLLATNGVAKLLATSTTTALDERSMEAARLRSIAEQVLRNGAETNNDFSQPASPVASVVVETLAIPVFNADDSGHAAAVLVLQRYAPHPTPLIQSLAKIRAEVEAATVDVAGVLRSRAIQSENRVMGGWRRATTTQRGAVSVLFGITAIVVLNIPVSFHLPVTGRLQPARSIGIFAAASGTLTRLHVVDATEVIAGTPLAELDNPEIELQQERLAGELASAETELATLRLGSSGDADRSEPTTSTHRRTRHVVLRARIESLKQQTVLMNEVKQSLSIQAPIDGRVMLRDDQADLVGQNIGQSQWLMQIVDPKSGYQAVLDLPEKDFGYVSHSRQHSEAEITAMLQLRSSPDVQFSGMIADVADTVVLDPRGNAVVELTLPVAAGVPPNGQVGATVVGTIHVGQRSLGFIWFRPLIELIRSYGW